MEMIKKTNKYNKNFNKIVMSSIIIISRIGYYAGSSFTSLLVTPLVYNFSDIFNTMKKKILLTRLNKE